MDNKDQNVIHLKSAAGELLCTVACEDLHIVAQVEYRPFALCSKGIYAGSMVPISSNGPWYSAADAQAALDDYMPVLRLKGPSRGIDPDTAHIESRIVFTAQSDWAPIN